MFHARCSVVKYKMEEAIPFKMKLNNKKLGSIGVNIGVNCFSFNVCTSIPPNLKNRLSYQKFTRLMLNSMQT